MLLEAVDLRKRFGRREVLHGVSISVGAGEIVGLLGRNGAGKTTTFRIVMGLLRPDSGAVRFDGRPIDRLPVFRRARLGMGYLAQEPSVFQRMSVRDNLLAVLEFVERSGSVRRKRADRLLEEFGLTKVADQPAHTLSGGEKRRLEIARAMVREPRLMMLDEPFSGVDPIGLSDTQDVVRGLKARGIGVILTDHNVRETLEITDRAYIIDEGRVLAHGGREEIVRDARVRARYLGERFRL